MPPLIPITTDWRPSDAVYQLLAQHSIPREYAEDQVPEFILYWQERGELNHSWGSKFLKHCIHEWRLHEVKQAQQARVAPMVPMVQGWRPNQKVLEHLLAQGITRGFIDECLVGFIMFWLERGDVRNTWQSMFVQHVQYRDQAAQRIANASTDGKRQRSIEEQLNDHSWAHK